VLHNPREQDWSTDGRSNVSEQMSASQSEVSVEGSPTPHWRDPLFSPGDRFPLGAPQGFSDGRDDEPSGSGTRPFSLSGVVTGPRMDVDLGVHYRYCPERQVSSVLSAEGSYEPLLKHTQPGPTPVTSGTTDGDPRNPPPEEMASPDHQSD
jgi:hypothetical protein